MGEDNDKSWGIRVEEGPTFLEKVIPESSLKKQGILRGGEEMDIGKSPCQRLGPGNGVKNIDKVNLDQP